MIISSYILPKLLQMIKISSRDQKLVQCAKHISGLFLHIFGNISQRKSIIANRLDV